MIAIGIAGYELLLALGFPLPTSSTTLYGFTFNFGPLFIGAFFAGIILNRLGIKKKRGEH